MRRLVRHLFTACSALSLVLWVAVCVLWVQGYRVGYGVRWFTTVPVLDGYGFRELDLRSARGGVGLAVTVHTATSGRGMGALRGHSLATRVVAYPPSYPAWWGGAPSFWNRLGFEFRHADSPNRYWDYTHRFWAVTVPYWSVFMATALGAMPCVVRCWRLCAKCYSSHRRQHGFCPSCGYDLRASPERCPECGAAASS